MYIEKYEPIEIASRQIQFLEQVHPELQVEILGSWFHYPTEHLEHSSTNNLLPYRYKFVPGKQPKSAKHIFMFLAGHVWFRRPINGSDTLSIPEYVDYVQEQATSVVSDEHLFTLIRAILLAGTEGTTRACLVHGDATLENFVQTKSTIVAIDPGHPRGFCHVENDVGKLLQSSLTHWEALKTQTEPMRFEHSLDFVSVVSITSLLCHWLRLLKHVERHEEFVLWHGRETIVPILATTIKHWVKENGISLDACRRGWGFDRLKTLYDHCLPPSM